MQTNIVTIDPSLTSTAIIINGKPIVIATKNNALTKKAALTRWFAEADNHAEVLLIDQPYKNSGSYSETEVAKLTAFRKTVTLIHDLLDGHIHNALEPTIVIIEGYAFASAAGHLVDLVTFGTLIRNMVNYRANTELVVLSPTTVKLAACKLTYEPIEVGKRVKRLEYRNHDNIAGGKFKKHQMYKALTDNETLQTTWVNFLREHEEEIMNLKKVPTPIDDINDAFIMYHVAQHYSQKLGDVYQLLQALSTI